MPKGTYRKKRAAVLEILEDLDPEWAAQIQDLRQSNPQAFRKECMKAEAFIGAKTGRKTTLSMRPKRFGGEEDPVLVRRVLALRKQMKDRTASVETPAIYGFPSPVFEETDVGGVEGWSQERTPEAEQTDRGASPGWSMAPAPEFPSEDRSRSDRGRQARSPEAEKADLGAAEGWSMGRSPFTEEAVDRAPAEGGRPGLHGMEGLTQVSDEEMAGPRPETRQSGTVPVGRKDQS